MFERYSFVAVTARDLFAVRRFWVDLLGFNVTEEREGHFIIDAGGLRLCFDRPAGNVHVEAGEEPRASPGTNPAIGLRVADVAAAVAELSARGLEPEGGIVAGERGYYARYRDPDGRSVIVTDADSP